MKDQKSIWFYVFLGLKDNGIFAGSRVTTSKDEPWEHAIVEAHRNLNNYKVNSIRKILLPNVIGQRTFYFGDHKEDALRQIANAYLSEWPSPKLEICSSIDTNIYGVYLHRSLCKEFLYWHLGDKTRFVY